MNLTTVINPVVAFNIFEYLTALDMLMNFQAKWDKMQRFSHTSLDKLRYEYGVPEPFDKVVFAILSLIAMIVTQRIIKKLFQRNNVNSAKFKFNIPDFSEAGIIVGQIKKMNDELGDIKKHLSGGELKIEGHVG